MATRTMDGHTTSAHSAMHRSHAHAHMSHYMRFAIMVGLSFVAMYVLMYAMANTLSDVFNNINQVYMAGLMAAPMAIIEILLMKSMYPNARINTGILVVSALALVFFWAGIRNQIGVGDQQFVRSMIPHHSGAIQMCREANIQDAELKTLCGQIAKSQQEEIDQMKRILSRIQ